MERIRVDTDQLKAHAKVFESSADIFAQVGKDILSFAATLPSYDGQLSTPARAAALEINRQCQDVSNCLNSDAQSLAHTAKAFEDVDSQTVKDLDNSTNGIGDFIKGIVQGGMKVGEAIAGSVIGFGEYVITYMVVEGSITMGPQLNPQEIVDAINKDFDGHRKGGNALMGYDYDKETGTLIVWYGKDVKVFHVDPNAPFPAKLDDYMHDIDAMDQAKFNLFLGLLTGLGSVGSFLTTEFDGPLGIAGGIILGVASIALIGANIGPLITSLINSHSSWEAIINNPMGNSPAPTIPQSPNLSPSGIP